MADHLVIKLGQLTDMVMDYIFNKYFTLFGGLCPKHRFFLIYETTAIDKKALEKKHLKK